MTVEEALKFFENVPAIARKIQTLYDVGLSYVKLGQPSTELSGGEAQRIKLATELSKRSTGKTIYILDEPTTGLHFADVHKLIEILRRLSDGGNTVIVIEHNLDVIKTADYIIDMGPEGGDGGGTVIAQGTPEEVAEVPESYTGYYCLLYTSRCVEETEREQVAKVTGTNKDETATNTPKKRTAAKVYPNDPCPWGSGKKYKQCCGKMA